MEHNFVLIDPKNPSEIEKHVYSSYNQRFEAMNKREEDFFNEHGYYPIAIWTEGSGRIYTR